MGLHISLSQGALQQRSSCHFTDGKSVMQRESGISKDIHQTDGKAKTWHSVKIDTIILLSTVHLNEKKKNNKPPKSQNCFSMKSPCCITCYYGYTQQSQAFIFDMPCDSMEAEWLTFKQTSGLFFNSVHQIGHVSVSNRSLSTVKHPNGKELSETNR